MNYLWEFMVKANQLEAAKENIVFQYPKRYSPYLELNFENLNEQKLADEVEINPYYRFYSVFYEMFPPDDEENQQLKMTLFDLFIHYIGEIDVNRGNNKRDYQVSFVQEDMKHGLFGRFVQENYNRFSFSEKKQLAHNLLRLYQTNQGVLIFKETIQFIYPKAIQFVHLGDKYELTVFLQTKKTEEEEKKVAVLKELFLPFKFSLDIYYEHMIGILEEEAFMKMEQFVIF
ncbi:hypothetical protein [Enterococcus sp. CWB-B31]|uniref:hypothetical protein n=1 Tax=Enterococcus sp. CWB-B31 TaxID=2885159 RepID=UPI001E3B7233|nr:hypothetical protein [Enterococcus sp. CWB-B31]MCB5954237.1 hypothetical protein [Enterococcus sp. CWB-B31]